MLRLFSIILLFFSLSVYSQSYLGYSNQISDLVDTNYTSIKHIAKGDALFLITIENQVGYYNVIHIKSNKEGFSPRKHVQIERVVPQTEKNIFTSVIKSEVKDPIVKVRNSSKQVLILKLNNSIIEIAPKEKRTLHLNQGKYYYRVSSQDIEPYYGVENIDNFHLYEWDFYIGDM